MSWAFDSASGDQNFVSGVTNTWNHTVTGSAPLLIVNLCGQDGTEGYPSAVSFNGIAMSRLSPVGFDGFLGTYSSSWFLLAPATGTHAVSVTTPNPQTNLHASSTSYTGILAFESALQTPHDGGSYTSIATPITTVADGCLVVGWAAANNGQAISAGSGTTSRGSASGSVLFDCGTPVSPSSYTLNFSWSSSAHANAWVASFTPTPVSGFFLYW